MSEAMRVKIGWEGPRNYVLRHWLFSVYLRPFFSRKAPVGQFRILGLYVNLSRSGGLNG